MIINLIKGFFIGLALVIPGLSASTFAVVTGLYDKMIYSINNIRRQFKQSMIFLLPIGIGAAIGILASANIVITLMEEFTLQCYSFFVGLVLGSVPTIYGKIKPQIKNFPNYALTLVSFVIIAALGFIVPSDEVVAIHAIESTGQFVTISSAGLLASFMLAIPGVSGSLIVILLGQYGTVYGAVSNFADVIFMLIRGEEGALSLGLSSGFIILAFGVGCIIGLLAAAKIIGFFIERFEVKVYFAVMGLVMGAVVTLFYIGVWDFFVQPGQSIAINAVILVVFAILGYICTRIMSRSGA